MLYLKVYIYIYIYAFINTNTILTQYYTRTGPILDAVGVHGMLYSSMGRLPVTIVYVDVPGCQLRPSLPD